MPPRYRLGIDIGGTFTDATLIDEDTGEIHIGKVSTTPRDPSRGFMEAAVRLLEKTSVDPADVRSVVHGTTVATNAIIEGKVARTAFITTEGFRDMLEIARQTRPSLYDTLFEKPKPLVPRQLCWGVPERLDAQGRVLQPLDEAAVGRVAEQLRQEKVQSIAVCLLHAYVNPEHEKRIAVLLQKALPEAVISLSSEVAPEFREYMRASTTVINACIRPVVARYLLNLEARLREARLPENLLVMQSSGGVMTSPAARAKPVYMVESGPAAGVMAATQLCNALGFRDALSFDMGGTTAKAGLIRNGSPRVTKDYEVGLTAQATGGSRSAGYPIRTPVIDLVEVGAGGGSIAWVDSGGMLRVGPESVGADPGPACYGKGGTVPTVTDANLVLGRLNPHYFLGGQIVLDVERARKAVESCAARLNMDAVQAAHAIVEIANASMVKALRLVSVQRGYDPRDFVLIAFGGAGPVHANRLAAEIDSASILIPTSPGTTSARGLLVTDLKHDYAATVVQRSDRLDRGVLTPIHRKLMTEGETALREDGVAAPAMRFFWQAEMRYVGQSYELAVTLPDGPLAPRAVADAVAAFHQEHERAYGYCAADEPVEWVNVRLTALGAIPKPELRRLPSNGTNAKDACKSRRPIYFAEARGYVDCPVYDRYRLGAGQLLKGPAIVEEMDSTTTIHPGYRAVVDAFGNLLVKK